MSLLTTSEGLAASLRLMRSCSTQVYHDAARGPVYAMHATVPGLGVLTDAADLIEQQAAEVADLARQRGKLLSRMIELTAERDALAKQIESAVQQADEAVASMWQHAETGDTRIVPVGSIATISGHFRFIGALYLHPADHPGQMLDMVQPDAEPSAPAEPQPATSPAGELPDDPFRDVVQFNGVTIKHYSDPQPTVAAVVLAEREACAKLCDSYAKHLRAFAYDSMATAAESCAESIRARTEGGAA